MRNSAKIAVYTLRDVARSRWLIGYGLFFFGVTDLLLRLGGPGENALLSLIDVVLFVIPLVTIVFATVYLYHARQFIEVLLAQPIRRRSLFLGLYAGMTLPLAAVFIFALGIPLAMHSAVRADSVGMLFSLIAGGACLTLVFAALAFLIATLVEDRVRGLGWAVAVWLVFAVLYDGGVLLFVALYGDRPVEKPLLALMLANPIDLVRVAILLQFDVAAMLGYTGAILQKFFGSSLGVVMCGIAVGGWIAAPLLAGVHAFRRKDF